MSGNSIVAIQRIGPQLVIQFGRKDAGGHCAAPSAGPAAAVFKRAAGHYAVLPGFIGLLLAAGSFIFSGELERRERLDSEWASRIPFFYPSEAAGGAAPRQSPAAAAIQRKILLVQIMKTSNSRNPTELADTILAESARGQIDPLVVAAVIKHESGFKTTARSHRGARGLMQLMPDTAHFTARRLGVDWKGAAALDEGAYNLRLGIGYLKYLEELFAGDRRLALMAYNWGPANVTRARESGHKIAAPVVNFARRILDAHTEWQEEFQSQVAGPVQNS